MDPANPKAGVLERRLRKVRSRPVRWGREVEFYCQQLSSEVGRGATVLEVACGTGFTLMELAARTFTVTGVEVDVELCRLVRTAARDLGVKVVTCGADACALPFAEGAFDAVYSRSFFEHVYDVDLALREQVRILRPGGVLMISDGNLLNLRTLFDLLFLYPLRTRGRHGGVRWLLTKRKVHRNLYGYLPLGRDEDVKTLGWWRSTIRAFPGLQLLDADTSAKYLYPGLPRFLRPFVGACHILARKVASPAGVGPSR